MLAAIAGGAAADSLDEPFVVDGRPLPEFNPTQAPYFQWRDAKAAVTYGKGVYFFEKGKCSAQEAIDKALAQCRSYFPQLCRLQAIGTVDVLGLSEAAIDEVAKEYQRRLTGALRSSAVLSGLTQPAIFMADSSPGSDGVRVAKGDLGWFDSDACGSQITIDVIGAPTCDGFITREWVAGITATIGTVELHCSNGDDLIGRFVVGRYGSAAKLRNQVGSEVRIIWGYDLWCRIWEHADFDVVIECPEEANYEQLSQTFHRSNFLESWAARMEYLRQQFKIATPEQLLE